MARMASVIDSDQHLYETRTTWLDHIDPDHRDNALRIVDDELGYPWLCGGPERRLGPVDVQHPGRTSELGDRRERIRAGLPPLSRYDDDLPRDYWDASARADRLAAMAVDEAVVFPNFGLLWERTLDENLGSLTANMTAWNRCCGSGGAAGRGPVTPVPHLTLRVHRRHSQRPCGAAARAAHRHRRAVGHLGADVPDDARRRYEVHHPSERTTRVPPAHGAERVLPPAGARVVVLVRAARSPHHADR